MGSARNFIGDYEYYLWKKAQEFESIKETSEDLDGARPTRFFRPYSRDGAAGPAERREAESDVI